MGTNETVTKAVYITNVLEKKYPGEKVALYDYAFKTTGQSLPLVLYLDHKNKLSNDGYKVGFMYPGALSEATRSAYTALVDEKKGFLLLDLSSSSAAELSKAEWALVNPSEIYHSTVEWYEDRDL